jgi:hypothetical protein
MLKSLYAHFDTDKLYIVKPTIVTLNENEDTILKTLDDEIDIALYDKEKIVGLIKRREYKIISRGIFNLKDYYLYDNNKVLLVKYLFESTYGTDYTKEMFENMKKLKPYYEIEEIGQLYNKIIQNEQKVKILK